MVELLCRADRLVLLDALRPRDRRELHTLVRRLWDIDVVRHASGPGSAPPLDYLEHTFFEPTKPRGRDSGAEQLLGRDCVVWANRGGGKTLLGAVATLLDLIYKPGIEVRVLGGSLEQATKMHEHLLWLLGRDTMRGVVKSAPTARRVVLRNGSRVEVLAGSQRSVRGVRVHKLRCDEVEELDPAVWSAAQLTTRSGRCGPVWVRGAVEALSTMHRPGGLMAQLLAAGNESDPPDDTKHDRAVLGSTQPDESSDQGPSERSATLPAKMTANGWRVFRWDAIDVAARCPDTLACDGCALWGDCGGRAKSGNGFIPVADLLQQRRRTSDSAWAAEMMCRRPGTSHAVFPAFDPAVHVSDRVTGCEASSAAHWVAGMDFGLRCPTVMLWAVASGAGPEAPLHVAAEYDARDRTLEQNLAGIDALRRRLDLPAAQAFSWLAIDPAGNARNAHSGRSDAAVLRQHGYRIRSRASRIEHGIESIRRRLDRGLLNVHPRCVRLIAALGGYHFNPRRPELATPVKDGPDHWCDALRYLVNELEHQSAASARQYL